MSASTVRDISQAISHYSFDRLYVAWFEAIVPRDASQAVQRSAERYIQALEGHFPA
ncbi:hypothetical protein [Ktedonobacter robiniae]|uniref:hypothetical protein n=1 Tax=Ktedonobacter robiniae TaxID=2778365 RepID=UPI0019158257|nr:hypothetical protein [Ktedonobacter robiniae]